jgi:non-ribosomal peptide synthetase component F
VYESVKELGRKNGVTLFMTLLAGFNVLLSRYTRQEDLLVASPIAGRNWRGIESLIGFFINTLILRTDLSGDPSFIGLLRRVREAALGAYDHQSLPFERLIEELQLHRDLNRMPLTQIAFNLQNAPRSSFKASQLSLSTMRGDLETADFDLALIMIETPSGLAGTMRYKTDLFQSALIKRMIGLYEILLREIISRPTATISELIEQLNQAEKRQLLDEHKDRKGVMAEKFKGARRKLVSQQ